MTVEEQITLLALGALSRDEAAALEKQIAGDPALRARLAQERAAAAAWTQAVEPLTPSPRVKQQLLQRIDASLSPASRPAPQPIATKPEPKAQPKKAGWRDALIWLFGGLSIAAAAAAIAFGVNLAGVQNNVAQMQGQIAQMQTTAQTTQSEIAALTERTAKLEGDLVAAQAQLTEAQTALAQAQQTAGAAKTEIETAKAAQAQAQADAQKARDELAAVQNELAVLLQPGATTARVPANKPGFEDGAISVTFAPNAKQALVSVANLPPLQPDQTYQVWLIKDGVPLPSSVFNTGVDGRGRLIVTGDEPFSAYQAFGITVEPAGGRPTPNPAGPIFLGELS
jgi:anti-sigma-K factor RskA